ncbi:MAG: DUF370 domain-containing protein [Clostridia bacterium]|nr:DUF370 domain-containing protein [Clostridia bacterium]
MYLHLGQEVVVRRQDIVGVFDMDNTTISPHTREFLNRAEREGRLTYVSYDLPRSFTVCAPRNRRRADRVYVSQIAPATLKKRSRNESI